MSSTVRLVTAYAASLAVTGAVQQVLLLSPDAHWIDSGFVPLAAFLLLITGVFGVALWVRPTRTALRWTAWITAAVMLLIGAVLYGFGAASITPGVGGTVMLMAAILFDMFFLAPLLLAVPIHWFVLRGACA